MRGSSLPLQLAGYAAMAGVGATWSLRARGTILCASDAPLNNSASVYSQLLGCVAALLLAWLTVQSTRLLVNHTAWARRLHVSLRAELLGTSPAQMALLSGLAALSEELFFRAALSSSLGMVTSALLFGAAHLSARVSSVPRALWACVMGLCFVALFRVSGSLLAPILAHWLINYENMQYICNYDPTPLHTDRASARGQ